MAMIALQAPKIFKHGEPRKLAVVRAGLAFS